MSRISSGSWATGNTIPPGPIVVIGSINMDLVCRVQRMPAAGETILGSDLSTLPGGKGANGKLKPADIDAAEGLLAHASVVVLQLEISIDTVKHAIAACRRLGVFVILDPAPVPAKGVPKEIFQVNVLTPNQREAEGLL